MAWNPDQYRMFAQPRLRPALDLLARVALDSPRTACDLGCGAGNVTKLIADRWPASAVVGVDESQEMLAEASRLGARVSWQQQGIAGWVPEEPMDLIYSNAALQWLPAHSELFTRLLKFLAPGGVLAVQMPRNFAAPSHALITETVRCGPWSARLSPLLRPDPVAAPRFYYEVVAPYAASVDIWETEYLQILRGPNPVKEWTKGTWLRPLLDALDESEREAFEEDYGRRVARAYPPETDGVTLYPFRRLFMVVTKS